MLTRDNDPNPLPEDYPCGAKDCGGEILYDATDNYYRCDKCDFEMPYEEFKQHGLFAYHLMEQYPDADIDELFPT